MQPDAGPKISYDDVYSDVIRTIFMTGEEVNTMMDEKRRSKRVPVFSMKLEISSLFKQDNEEIKNLEAPIEVLNISRGGIGFASANDLPLGFYFNACIQLGEEDAKLYTVVKIIRKEFRNGQDTIYGCELVGLAPVFNYIFDDYEKKFEEGLLDK